VDTATSDFAALHPGCFRAPSMDAAGHADRLFCIALALHLG